LQNVSVCYRWRDQMKSIGVSCALAFVGVVSGATAPVNALAQSTGVALRIEGVVSPGSYLYTRKGGDGNLDGQTLVACVKFDPLSAPNQSGDGLTYRIESSSSKPYVTVSLSFSGGLNDSTSKAGTASPDTTELYRNYPNGSVNEVLLSVHHQQLNPDGTYKGNFLFDWQAFDGLGPSPLNQKNWRCLRDGSSYFHFNGLGSLLCWRM
jgi:hypothetical protein